MILREMFKYLKKNKATAVGRKEANSEVNFGPIGDTSHNVAWTCDACDGCL